MIWKEGEASLLKFFEEINTCPPSIKFECHYSRSIINFLDLNVHLDPSGYLKASLYSKPFDRNAYLHHKSCHPPKQIANIPYGQFLRIKKICSSPSDALTAIQNLEAKFLDRGYPKSHMESQKQRTPHHPSHGQSEKTKLWHPLCHDLLQTPSPHPKIINNHWHLLQTQGKIADSFQERPVLAYRRNKKP